MSLRGAASISQIPHSTLQDRVNITNKQNTLRNEIKTKYAGHPTVCSVGEILRFVCSLKDLTGSCFGCIYDQTRRGALFFDNTKVTNYLWDNDKMCVGKEWFSCFLNINGDIALKEPEGLSRARAQKLNNKAADGFFFIYVKSVYGTQYP